MTRPASIYEKTSREYLDRVQSVIQSGRMAGKADILGVEWDGRNCRVRFLNEWFQVTPMGIYHETGAPASFIRCVVLLRYLLHHEDYPLKVGAPIIGEGHQWTAYKEFKDAAPLINYFTHDTEAAIVRNFSGRVPALVSACRMLGGVVDGKGLSCDLAVRIPALPKIPLFLVFYDADDEFPATCSVLFERRAEAYLDMESLAILGSLLIEGLIRVIKNT